MSDKNPETIEELKQALEFRETQLKGAYERIDALRTAIINADIDSTVVKSVLMNYIRKHTDGCIEVSVTDMRELPIGCNLLMQTSECDSDKLLVTFSEGANK